jgi:formamidopyrimidine-DNA glycosylase
MLLGHHAKIPGVSGRSRVGSGECKPPQLLTGRGAGRYCGPEIMMFELPEYLTIARQMNETLRGKTVAAASLGNSPHKFVWYNRKPDEFASLTRGKTVGPASVKGRWLFLKLKPGYVLVFGECGGRLIFHPTGSDRPEKYHLLVEFSDGSALSATTQMWGACELYEAGREQERKYVKGMRPTPVEPGFTFDYFSRLIDSLIAGEKRSVKGLLVQDQLIPGLGNAIAQDIMFRARLHPRRSIAELGKADRRRLYQAIVKTVKEVTAQGGRSDECDFLGRPGGYARLMDAQTAGRPCPECGRRIQKQNFLGGAIYFCRACQQ